MVRRILHLHRFGGDGGGAGGTTGNPVRIRDCPAAVIGNDRHHPTSVGYSTGPSVREAMASRKSGTVVPRPRRQRPGVRRPAIGAWTAGPRRSGPRGTVARDRATPWSVPLAPNPPTLGPSRSFLCLVSTLPPGLTPSILHTTRDGRVRAVVGRAAGLRLCSASSQWGRCWPHAAPPPPPLRHPRVRHRPPKPEVVQVVP